MILKVAEKFAPVEEGQPSYVDLIRVTASDISPTACDMSLINFTLWGIPAEVCHQNTLSLETWGHWQNIHWHRVGENERRAFREFSKLLQNPSSKKEGEERDENVSDSAAVM